MEKERQLMALIEAGNLDQFVELFEKIKYGKHAHTHIGRATI